MGTTKIHLLTNTKDKEGTLVLFEVTIEKTPMESLISKLLNSSICN
jgi:hypothetical protein